jgi:hypothetical protein
MQVQVAEWRRAVLGLGATINENKNARVRAVPTECTWMYGLLDEISSARPLLGELDDDHFHMYHTEQQLVKLAADVASALKEIRARADAVVIRKGDYKKAYTMAKAGATRSEVVTYLEGLTAKPSHAWDGLDRENDCLEESAVRKVIEQITGGYGAPESIELENKKMQVQQENYEKARREQSSLHALINDNRRMVEDGCFGVPVEDLKFKIVPPDLSNDAMYKFECRFKQDPAYRREFLNTSYTPWSLLKLPLHVWESQNLELLPRKLYSFLGTRSEYY